MLFWWSCWSEEQKYKRYLSLGLTECVIFVSRLFFARKVRIFNSSFQTVSKTCSFTKNKSQNTPELAGLELGLRCVVSSWPRTWMTAFSGQRLVILAIVCSFKFKGVPGCYGMLPGPGFSLCRKQYWNKRSLSLVIARHATKGHTSCKHEVVMLYVA